MKMYDVLITHSATEDLKNIASYIANELREPLGARNLIANIKEAVVSLKQMPLRYALIADENLAVRGIRKLMVDNYIVFYVVSERDNSVTILRILYSKRDWENLL